MPIVLFIQESKDLLQFRKRGLENLEKLSIMYKNINVTGESSIMPGYELPEGAEVHDVEDDNIEEEEVQISQGKHAKRGAGKINGNPNKKNLVQRDFKHMVDHLISEDALVNSNKSLLSLSSV